MKLRATPFFIFGVLLLGASGSFYFGRQSATIPPSHSSKAGAQDSTFPLLNPALDCGIGRECPEFRELPDLYQNIQAYVNTAKSQGILTDAGVYFRDLNNGPWYGINEDVDFSPASLLKLPIMLAYFKLAEQDASILDKKVPYVGLPAQFNQAQPDTPQQQTLTVGKSYSIHGLIERMIVYSDNNAKDLLQVYLPESVLEGVFVDTGISPEVFSNAENSLSVKEYASFFRVLYNASYLNQQYSNMALELLTRSTFTRGLIGGLPENIQVAHKYGIRNIDANNSTRQLHDCGIVYYPQSPYLLCVMSRGPNLGDLGNVIRDISKLVYANVTHTD